MSNAGGDAGGPNADQIELWNRDEALHWVAEADRYDGQLRPLGDAAMERAAFRPGERVLDVGCGCGQTTMAIAARVGPSGSVTGIDISEPMVRRAAETANQEAIDNVSFELADAQTHELSASSFDAAYSRFGIMFFSDPVAAFANLARALRPGGRLVFACWRELGQQPWVLVPAVAALEHVPLPDLGEPGQPGMFALADPDRTRSILTQAGFVDVAVDAVDRPITYAGGGSADQVVDFLRAGNFGQTLLADAAPDAAWAAMAAARDALAQYETPEGVVLDAGIWVVSARAR